MKRLNDKTIIKNGNMHIYLLADRCDYYYDMIVFENVGAIRLCDISEENADDFGTKFNKLVNLLESDIDDVIKVKEYLEFCAYYDDHTKYYVVENTDEIPDEENEYYFKLNGIWCYDEL